MPMLYIYVLDTLADWEIAHLTAEVHSRRFFKPDAPDFEIRFAGCSMDLIRTMGGIRIKPDCLIHSIKPEAGDILVLPGAETWNEEKNRVAIDVAKQFLQGEKTAVAAICGATVSLATAGILDTRSHTSNGVGFLDAFVPSYRGQMLYRNERSVRDGNLITAGSFGELLFAKHILQYMGVMSETALNAWYEYFERGDAGAFFRLMDEVMQYVRHS